MRMNIHKQFFCCILALAIVSISLGKQQAVADQPSYSKQAEYLLKALKFDRNIKQRSQGVINIAILHTPEQLADAKKVSAAFEDEALKSYPDGLQGQRIQAQTIAFKSVTDLRKSMKGYNMIYVHESMANALSSVQQIAQAFKIPSMSGLDKAIEKGIAVAVEEADDSYQVAVNLRASRLYGMNLSAELLKISRVLK